MQVSIMGTRGIPANHGGFETFAEHLALYLVGRGHQVTVYCQRDGPGAAYIDEWHGVRRVTLRGSASPLGTIVFDWAAARHACGQPGAILTLGYNTAIFSILYRLHKRPSLMNMDGIEWQREKWSPLQRLWLRLNERAGVLLSDHLVADHPEICKHLGRIAPASKVTMIPYEAESVACPDPTLIRQFDLTPHSYGIVVARPEPENSLLEIVQAFSRKPRGMRLLILGNYDKNQNRYHAQVMHAAGSEILFLGAIYDKTTLTSLRSFAQVYVHGHRVGGTNPSLVESLAAGNPIIAHDNRFTRWVAGPEQQYFTGTDDLSEIFDHLSSGTLDLERMASAARQRHLELFTPEKVLPEYEKLLLWLTEREDVKR